MCSIKNATVTLTAQILLPRWTPPADAEPGLVAEWERFIGALETHEAGHKDIGAKTGRDIAEQLRGLSGLCSQINTRASDIAREILEKGNGQQKVYDAVIRHGLTATSAAYAAVGLTTNVMDSTAHAIGNSLTVRGKIAGTPLSEVVDCGAPASGWNADSVAVTLFVTSRIEVNAPSGSTVTNTVQAFTRSEGAGAVVCRSRGVLERRLLDEVRRRLAGR